jgi:hypothetical protein
MTQDELEEQIKELVDDYLMANDEDVDITINACTKKRFNNNGQMSLFLVNNQ